MHTWPFAIVLSEIGQSHRKEYLQRNLYCRYWIMLQRFIYSIAMKWSSSPVFLDFGRLHYIGLFRNTWWPERCLSSSILISIFIIWFTTALLMTERLLKNKKSLALTRLTNWSYFKLRNKTKKCCLSSVISMYSTHQVSSCLQCSFVKKAGISYYAARPTALCFYTITFIGWLCVRKTGDRRVWNFFWRK